MENAVPSCFKLLMHLMDFAFSLAWLRAGRSIEARIAMIAITTRSSIRVKIFFFISLVPFFQVKYL
jgi:hypothetical protein